MWDKPHILNRVADLLFAVSGLLAGYAAVILFIHLPIFPLRMVRVDGPLEHVTDRDIKTVVTRELRGNFFTLNLAVGRAALEKLPWVRNVDLRRRWPDQLEVMIEEHVPLARWGDLGLVDTHGDVFRAAYGGELPVFIGPPGTARELAVQYEHFRRGLAPINKVPVQIVVSPRRAWQVRLEDGLTLELGREQTEARLTRFVEAYARTIGRLARRIDYVDLRYANGFAVRIPELKFKKSRPKAREGVA